MAIVRFNKGGDVDVTVSATTGTDLVVNINGHVFTTAGEAAADDTAATFVKQHSKNISQQFGIFTSSSTTTLTFNGISDARVTVTSGGSLGSANVATELGVDFNFMLLYKVATSTQITVALNASSFASTEDVLTLDFLSSSNREEFILSLQEVLNAQESGKSVIDSPVVCSASLG